MDPLGIGCLCVAAAFSVLAMWVLYLLGLRHYDGLPDDLDDT